MLYGWIILCFLWFIFLCSFPINRESIKKLFQKRKAHEELMAQFIDFKSDKPILEYKFYGGLFSELIQLQKSLGISIKTSLREFRIALGRDIKSDSKVQNIKLNSLTQYFSMCFFTWFFLFYMSSNLKTHLNDMDLVMILIWQLMGAYLFHYFIQSLRTIYCDSFNRFLGCLYRVKYLLNSSQPLQVVKKTMEQSFRDEHSKLGRELQARIHLLLASTKSTGSLDLNELDCLISETWDSYDLNLEKYEKSLIGLKMVLFLLFIIPTCLYSITLAVGQLGT